MNTSLRLVAPAVLLACLASSLAEATPLTFSLDAPSGGAGLISAETPQSSGSQASTFGGNLAGDLEPVSTGSPGSPMKFSFGTGNVFALENDLMVERSGSVGSGGDMLTYTISTTLSGFAFELANGVVLEGNSVWAVAPMITPTAGTLSSVLSGTFTHLGITADWSGSASASVSTVAVRADQTRPASLQFELIPNPPGSDLSAWTLSAILAASFGHTNLNLSVPTVPGLDLGAIMSPVVVDHYDTTLTLFGEMESTALAPIPLPASGWMFGSGLAFLAWTRRRSGSRARC